jgi:DNA-directed RNA polymerase subunit N (RpoN/RPB10)
MGKFKGSLVAFEEDSANVLYRDAMDQLGCKRYCCRRMIMTHVDLIEKLLKLVLSNWSYRKDSTPLLSLADLSTTFLLRRLTFLTGITQRNETQRRQL